MKRETQGHVGISIPRATSADRAETTVRAGIVDVLVLTSDALTDARDKHESRADRWRVLALRRASGTRCTGAWEIVHGRIELGERPVDAAVRELQEECGMDAERIYSITVNPFYMVQTDSVELAIVFAAIVDHQAEPRLSEEHDAAEWLTPEQATARLAWPREREALAQAMSLLAMGDAGHVEDVLRVK